MKWLVARPTVTSTSTSTAPAMPRWTSLYNPVCHRACIVSLTTLSFCLLYDTCCLSTKQLAPGTAYFSLCTRCFHLDWYICSTPSCTGSMFRSELSISSEWQFTGVSKTRLPSTSWTAATPHRMLPVVSDFDLPAATILSYHDIVAARSAVRRSPSPVRWPGMHCLTTSETRRSVPIISGRS